MYNLIHTHATIKENNIYAVKKAFFDDDSGDSFRAKAWL